MKRFLCPPAALLLWLTLSLSAAAPQPNIIYILHDDLGYGDVSCLNPGGKIKTPHMDRLAREGMTFTDAHSGSAVCTPTRYGILTGRYAWRSRLKNGVLGGLSPRLIEPGRATVASLLQQQGYHTAAIGKWHLGMDWAVKPGKEVTELNIEKPAQVWNVDFTQPIKNGPTSVGFNYFFGISASLDMVPYTYIQHDRVLSNPTEDRDFPMMLGRTDGRTRKGPAAPEFEAMKVLPVLVGEATQYITERAGYSRDGKPFFLYLPLASPHTPILPTKEWQGKSGLNAYADFVMASDWAVGEIMRSVAANGLEANTIIIVTSDNGCSPQADFAELLRQGHNPSHTFRGHKADIFEGGHRVPFIVRWPAKVAAGSRYDETICLTDLFATVADILGAQVPANAAEDSVSLLPVLLGRTRNAVREATVHHSINGSFAIRQGPWKLALCPDSGGWSAPRPGAAAAGFPAVQLYNLKDDVAEQKNLAGQHPEVVQRLTALLERYARQGRSTPGAAQPNNGEVSVHRPAAAAKQKK